MSLRKISIKYEKLRDLTTEVLFHVADARVSGFPAIRFDVSLENGKYGAERTVKYLARILRGMKKRGAIQFFVTEEGFSRSSTEAKYLLNVLPETEHDLPDAEKFSFVFVKL